jgi:hypothetical protein
VFFISSMAMHTQDLLQVPRASSSSTFSGQQCRCGGIT